MLSLEDKLDIIFEAAAKKEWRAAVGIVQCGDKYLLGLAKNCSDDRSGKWVCPGGGVKKGETPEKAAVREVSEETGIKCRAVGKAFNLPDKPDVAFVHCRARSGQTFNNNHEFAAVGFFTRREMRALKLYHNVSKLIDKVK